MSLAVQGSRVAGIARMVMASTCGLILADPPPLTSPQRGGARA